MQPYSDNSWKITDPFSGNKRKNIMKYVHIVIIVHLFLFLPTSSTYLGMHLSLIENHHQNNQGLWGEIDPVPQSN